MRDDLHLAMFEIPSDFFSETMSKQENAIYITEGAAGKEAYFVYGRFKSKAENENAISVKRFFSYRFGV